MQQNLDLLMPKSWKLLDLPIIPERRGNLTFIEGEKHIPFAVERVHYLYDVPSGSERGGHAHQALQQLIVAVAGSFDVHLDNGHTKETISLNRSYLGILMQPMVWRTIDNFSSNAVCLVLASRQYDEADYIRDYRDFKLAVSAA